MDGQKQYGNPKPVIKRSTEPTVTQQKKETFSSSSSEKKIDKKCRGLLGCSKSISKGENWWQLELQKMLKLQWK